MTPPPLHLVVPGPLDQRTGGYIYDRRMVDGLRALGWTIQVHELAGRFPRTDEVACVAAAEAIAAMPPGALPVIDGLALPAFADLGERLRSEEHTSELQSRENLVCRLLLAKKNARSSRSRSAHA